MAQRGEAVIDLRAARLNELVVVFATLPRRVKAQRLAEALAGVQHPAPLWSTQPRLFQASALLGSSASALSPAGEITITCCDMPEGRCGCSPDPRERHGLIGGSGFANRYGRRERLRKRSQDGLD